MIHWQLYNKFLTQYYNLLPRSINQLRGNLIKYYKIGFTYLFNVQFAVNSDSTGKFKSLNCNGLVEAWVLRILRNKP